MAIRNKMSQAIILGSASGITLVAIGLLESVEQVIQVVSFAVVAFCIWLVARLVNRGWKPRRRFWIIAAVVAVLAYPLSWGPAARIFSSGMSSKPAAMIYSTLYHPIILINRNSESACAISAAYLNLWGVKTRKH